jgi:tetratricopeptide (TPR) repeat protein
MRTRDRLRGHVSRAFTVIALVAITLGCEPWYRTDETLGRRAVDARARQHLIDHANAELAAGHAGRAEVLLRHVLDDNPLVDGDIYVLFGRVATAAGHRALARAAVRWRLDRLLADTPSIEATNRMRRFLITSLADDDLTADAIDIAGLDDASLRSIPAVAELISAYEQRGTADAVTRYEKWVRAYGIPDHDTLRRWRAEILRRPIGPLDPGALGDAALARGDTTLALLYYGRAFRSLPDDVFLQHAAGFVRAAASVSDPAVANPVAYQLALDGDAAARANRLGPALRSYRRAVAEAPWWATAHSNLARLFAEARRDEESRTEAAWASWLREGGRGPVPIGERSPR